MAELCFSCRYKQRPGEAAFFSSRLEYYKWMSSRMTLQGFVEWLKLPDHEERVQQHVEPYVAWWHLDRDKTWNESLRSPW